MSSFKTGWYLLYTRPNREKKISEQLSLRKVDHYLPTLNATRTYCDRVKVISLPLFPSYIFIHLDCINEYFESLNIDGVLNFVKFGGEVARVPDIVVEGLKRVVEHGEDIEVSFSEFRKGQPLTLSEGPLAGLQCEMVEYDSKERILVRINLLRRNILLRVASKKVIVV